MCSSLRNFLVIIKGEKAMPRDADKTLSAPLLIEVNLKMREVKKKSTPCTEQA